MSDLIPRQPDATPAAYDAATLAVLHTTKPCSSPRSA